MLKLNETPVRTSKNFNINNIEIDKSNIIDKITKFDNVMIKGISDINNTNKNAKLVYGIHEILEKQVIEKANKKIRFEIDKDDKENKEIKFEFDNDNLYLVENIQIIAKENSNSSIVIKYESNDNITSYHNGIINVEARENAKLDIIIVNLLNDMSQNFLSIQNTLDANAKITYTIIDFGGKNCITNYYSNLLGDSSKNDINVIYLGKNEQLLDLNYIAELRGENTIANIEAQGALKDVSKKHFKGTLDFKTGCKKAIGNENESCLMLSDKAKSLALPMLLCSEENVEGNHSTSSGKVGNKELFYIMSRGFSKKQALKLLVKAKFNNILDNLKDEDLKSEILKQIDSRLD